MGPSQVAVRRPGSRPSPQAIRGTAHAEPPAVHDMRVNHRRPQVSVPEKLLNRADVRAALEQMRREGVSQGMTGGPFRQPGCANGGRECPLERRVMQMIATACSGARFNRRACGGKYPLPGPIGVGTR